MVKDIDFYFEGQSEKSKLIYTLGIVWSQISSRLDFVLAKKGLNISKFNILMIIKHIGKDEGLKQNEISKRLLVTASNITKLLDRLEAEGMITRNAKQNDRRVKLIKITPAASMILDEVWGIYLEEIKDITSKFDDKEAKDIYNILLNKLVKV